MYDCLIVGAGPAGATAAYHLAKQGHKVLLLDKTSLPRYKPCGGGVSPAIAQWFDFDFTPVIEQKVNKVKYTWKLDDPAQARLGQLDPMWMVDRGAFDQLIVNKAIEQGAQLEVNAEVISIQAQPEGWSVKTATNTYSGKYLIGADGVDGYIAKSLGLGTQEQSLGATLEVTTPQPPENPDTAYFEFGLLKNGYIWNFPKAQGYTISGAIFRGNKTKVPELKKQILDYANKFGLNVSNAKYSEYKLGLWQENRVLHTEKAVIIGEAAGILDPLTGEGIRPAIWTGLQASIAIDKALQGDSKALSEYTQTVEKEWGNNMVLAQRLAGIFYQFPKIAYKVGVKRPGAGKMMAQILSGKLSYSDITDRAMSRLKKSLIPGMK